MISAEELLFLEGLAREVQPPECIVEVGSYRGRSTAALAAGSRAGGGAAVYAIEPHEQFTGVLGGQFGRPARTPTAASASLSTPRRGTASTASSSNASLPTTPRPTTPVP